MDQDPGVDPERGEASRLAPSPERVRRDERHVRSGRDHDDGRNAHEGERVGIEEHRRGP
jgi:hypothetical protein